MTTVGRLHLISDRARCPLERLPEVAALAVRGGVDTVHLREKDLPGGVLLELAGRLREAINGRAALIVNERVDVAVLAGADGVQLGEAGLPIDGTRRLLGDRLIGRSVHDRAGAWKAGMQRADFLLAGHVYETGSKAGQPGRGLRMLGELAGVSHLPVVAIGGITPERVVPVLRAGAWGVAVLSGILAADEPEAAARRYREVIEEELTQWS
ncbi:MAG TPA: thiamine phosphate synthase [Nitrolancea sp.]|nr:thiamine phosphate synthase [Nitrolancea sp.]